MRKQGADDKAIEFVKQPQEPKNTIRRASGRIDAKIRARLKAMEPKKTIHRDRGGGGV